MKYVGVDLHTTQLTVYYRNELGAETIQVYYIDMIDKFWN